MTLEELDAKLTADSGATAILLAQSEWGLLQEMSADPSYSLREDATPIYRGRRVWIIKDGPTRLSSSPGL